MNQQSSSSFDRLNLDKLVASEANYGNNIPETINVIQKDKNLEESLKKIILFCKYVLSVNGTQRKKYLCLQLIRDIAENFKSEAFEKNLDEHIPSKLMKTITSEIVTKQQNQSRNLEDEEEYSAKLVQISVETICFWTKKLSHLSPKSNFSEVMEEIKKLKVPIPKTFEYYKMESLMNGMFGDKTENEEEFVRNEEMTPLLSELHDKFNDCKVVMTERLNIALENDQELYLKEVIEKIREFLLLFFSRYRALEEENSIDRDVLIVYFHIMNNVFKKIAHRMYIPTYEMITITKEIFEGNHSSDFASIDRMDIVNLAGIHKYNALSIFQRIHHKIQEEEKKLGVCQVTIEQQQIREKERERQRDRQALKRNSKEKTQPKKTVEDSAKRFGRNPGGGMRR